MIDVRGFGPDEFMRLCRQEALADEVRSLADRALERNVFYEEWILLSALEFLREEADVRLLCLRNTEDQLVGLFPLELVRHPRLGAVPLLPMSRHAYCFLCTPLIDPRYAAESAAALARWIESGKAPAVILEFHAFAADGQFGTVFLPALTGRAGWVSDSGTTQRALLKTDKGASTGLSTKHKKELRRIERRLNEIGEIRYCVLRPEEDCAPWVDKFLALEASGWKGQAGTAIGSREGDRMYFRRIAAAAHRRSRLQLMALELNGATVAMKCNFLAIPGSFAFKIAYDESFHKYSPGVLLEQFNIEYAKGWPEVRWMDSCADPGHPMIERLWTDRKTIGWQVACGPGIVSRALVMAAPRYRRLKIVCNRLRTSFFRRY